MNEKHKKLVETRLSLRIDYKRKILGQRPNTDWLAVIIKFIVAKAKNMFSLFYFSTATLSS